MYVYCFLPIVGLHVTFETHCKDYAVNHVKCSISYLPPRAALKNIADVRKSNLVARSRNQCCSGKATIHFVCCC